MKLTFRIVLPALLVILSFQGRSQSTGQDSIVSPDSSKTRLFRLSIYGYSDSLLPDSSFNSLKSYDQLLSYPTAYTGNPGGARYSPLVEAIQVQPLWNGGYDSYLIKREEVTYYYSPNPYSDITFINGGGREQFFNIIHSQNFGKSLNVKIDLTKRGSDGFYDHLRTNHSLFNVSTNFESRYKRYGFAAVFLTNRLNAQENGGFSNFSNLDNPDLPGAANLENALNRFKENEYYTRHYYRLGKMSKTMDKDSIEQKELKAFAEIAYEFGYSLGQKWYEDDPLKQSFYDHTYFNNTTTFDSSSLRRYDNNITLSAINNNRKFVGFRLSHEFQEYIQSYKVDTSYNNYRLGGYLNIVLFDFNWKSEALYCLEGYNAEDLLLKTEVSKLIKPDSSNKRIRYSVGAELGYKEPEYFLLRYRSNNNIWNNSFDKVRQVKLRGELNLFGFDLKGELANVSRLIYFNSTGSPEQTGENIQSLTVTAKKSLDFGNFHLDNQLTYQNLSNKEVLPLPEFLAKETFYYRNFLFKKALLTRIGFSFFYYTAHYGYDYSPSISQFNLQNDFERTLLGDYPMLDVFIDLKIKRMRIFFMMSHVNEGLSGQNFYRIPNYPLPPRVFKFGLNWKFYN